MNKLKLPTALLSKIDETYKKASELFNILPEEALCKARVRVVEETFKPKNKNFSNRS